MSVSLFLTNIFSKGEISPETIHGMFETCGPIEKWNRLKDPSTGLLKSTAFVTYQNAEGACRALRCLKRFTMDGEVIAEIKVGKKIRDNLIRYKKEKILAFARMQGEYEKEEDIPVHVLEAYLNMQKEEDTKIMNQIKMLLKTTSRTTSRTFAVKNAIKRFISTANEQEEKQSEAFLSNEIQKFRQFELDRAHGKLNRENERKKQAEKLKNKLILMEQELANNRKRKQEHIYGDVVRAKKRRFNIAETNEEQRRKRLEQGNSSIRSNDQEILQILEHELPVYLGKTSLEKHDEPETSISINVGVDSQTKTTIEQKNSTLFGVEEKEKVQKKDLAMTDKDIEKLRLKSLSKEEKISLLDPVIISKDIPSKTSELFSYKINWEVVDTYKVSERIRSLVENRVHQCLGVKEETLIEFIVNQIKIHTDIFSILEDVKEILDEKYVEEIWRGFIYEIIKIEKTIELFGTLNYQ